MSAGFSQPDQEDALARGISSERVDADTQVETAGQDILVVVLKNC